MDLTKIVSISGKSGLFKVVTQGKNAVIVESLADQKRFPAFSHEKMSSLEEISIFTTNEDRPLKDVLKVFHEKLEGKAAVDPKSDNTVLVKFFQEMVPDFDSERVYVSDIRKMISWYNTLLAQNMLDFSEPVEEKPAEVTVESEKSAAEVEKQAPQSETSAKEEETKPALKTEKPSKKATTQVQPEKKSTRKKKTE